MFPNKKIDKLKELIQSLYQKKIEVDVILLCETFLHTEALKLVQIQNFSPYYNNRENTTGEGIAMYLNDKFLHKEQLDLDLFEKGFFKYKFCEVAINMKFKILLSELFRVPNTSKKVLEIFAQKVGYVNSLNYSMIILGTDQNLDLSKMSQHQNTENCLDICLEYKMIPSIQ